MCSRRKEVAWPRYRFDGKSRVAVDSVWDNVCGRHCRYFRQLGRETLCRLLERRTDRLRFEALGEGGEGRTALDSEECC